MASDKFCAILSEIILLACGFFIGVGIGQRGDGDMPAWFMIACGIIAIGYIILNATRKWQS